MTYFMNYSNYKIDLANPTITFCIIFLVILLLIVTTLEKHPTRFFDLNTTHSLRGLAVLFLLLGHLSEKCLKQQMFFESGGYWAVIIFLFISGYGLYQRYRLTDIRGNFWKKRIVKLYIPLWMTLILFILLDIFLIRLYHPLPELLLNFLGIHLNGALIRVNAVAWFVEYIMVLYFIYWLASKLPCGEVAKLLALFLFCIFVSMTVYISPIKHYHSIWVQYTIVFPCGVLCSKYENVIVASAGKIRNRLFLLVPIIISLLILHKWEQFDPVHLLEVIRPFALILAIVLGLMVYEELNVQSAFLMFIGGYSYEIYLLHIPFMVKYDFVLFRKPLYLSFFVYFAVLLFLSFLLAKASAMIHGRLMNLADSRPLGNDRP